MVVPEVPDAAVEPEETTAAVLGVVDVAAIEAVEATVLAETATVNGELLALASIAPLVETSFARIEYVPAGTSQRSLVQTGPASCARHESTSPVQPLVAGAGMSHQYVP